MPIPGSVLGSWSHHHSNKASIQAHTSIRKSLESYNLSAKGFKHNVFLQGSYSNNTNLRKDSDIDVVVQLLKKLPAEIASLSGTKLLDNDKHKLTYKRWISFRRHILKALRATYGTTTVNTGSKSIKVAKGQIHASADVVVAILYKEGLAFYPLNKQRWITSYPKQHQDKGSKKEEATNNRFKRTIRMFKATRNYLEDNDMIEEGIVTSYFIECLLYNVPDKQFKKRLDESYCAIVEYLEKANLDSFKCQNGIHKLFGDSPDLWNQDEARTFIRALRRLWQEWPDTT